VMAKLLIEVECGDRQCFECGWRTMGGGGCSLFAGKRGIPRRLKRTGNQNDRYRCSSCLAAERKAKEEE